MKVQKQLFLEDLSPKQIAVIERRMRPHKYSSDGFLNQNQSLREVIEADAKVLEQGGVTHKQIGDKLDSLMGQLSRQHELALRYGPTHKPVGDRLDSLLEQTLRESKYLHEVIAQSVLVGEFLRVSVVDWRGVQQCPFFSHKVKLSKSGFGHIGYDCGTGSSDYTVKNESQGTEIRFPQLMAHLVRDHHFFEGDTPYRLNPKNAVKVLELRPGVDYTPKTETEFLWQGGRSTSDIHEDFYGTREIIRSAERQVVIAKSARLYLSGDKGVIVAKKVVQLAEPLKIDGAEVLLYHNSVSRGQQVIKRIEHKYVAG